MSVNKYLIHAQLLILCSLLMSKNILYICSLDTLLNVKFYTKLHFVSFSSIPRFGYCCSAHTFFCNPGTDQPSPRQLFSFRSIIIPGTNDWWFDVGLKLISSPVRGKHKQSPESLETWLNLVDIQNSKSYKDGHTIRKPHNVPFLSCGYYIYIV